MSILKRASHVAILGGTHVATAPGGTVNINQGSQAGGSAAFDHLSAAAAHTAMHDSAARFDSPRCHRNTRTKYLNQLELWMLGETQEFEGKRVIWLYGSAGAGKSAIMQSIMERCARHGVILGFFFFSRSDPSRNYAEVLIPTLAYQVVSAFPEAMVVLDPIVRHNPLIFKASLRTQAYELLVRPILFLIENRTMDTTSLVRGVFAIDGLDECSDPRKQELLIHVITSLFHEYHIPICLLIASRPEVAIASAFQKDQSLHNMLATISLDSDSDVECDIRQFIEDSFLDILDSHPWRHHIDSPWPNSRSIDTLVRKSSGHFIFATTAMKFIASSHENPCRALKVVEGIAPSRTGSPFLELDALYMHVLTSSKYRNEVLKILRHLFFSRFNNTVSAVCYIYDISPEDVVLFLSDIQSLVSLTPNSIGEIVITPRHASLQEFFWDEKRSRFLYISMGDHHASLLARYFQLLDNGTRVPLVHLRHGNVVDMRGLIFGLNEALVHSKDVNLLLSAVSCHNCYDIWNFCVEACASYPTMSSRDIRSLTMNAICAYMNAIRNSLAVDDIALYFHQFEIYMELLQDDLDDFVHWKPHCRIIPALIFSSGPSGLLLAGKLTDVHGTGLNIPKYYSSIFLDLVDCTERGIDPLSFRAIKSLPQSRLSWSADLSLMLKLVLQQLLGLLGKPIRYSNSHKRWLQRAKPWKQQSLGVHLVPSRFYAGFQGSQLFRVDLPAPPSSFKGKSLFSRPLYHFWQGHTIRRRRKRCSILLKAVILYLHKSDSTIDVVKLARKSLPQAASAFPKLLKRARHEMDAYVRRWEESLDGLLEQSKFLSINSMD